MVDDINRIRSVFDPFGTAKPAPKPRQAPKWIQEAIAPQRAKPNLTPRPQQSGGLQATPWSLGGWLENKAAAALGGVFGEREGARLGSRLFSAINDFTPVGDAVGMDAGGRQAFNGLTRGHLGQAAAGVGTFALSALPGVLERPVRAAAANTGLGQSFSRLLRDESGAIRNGQVEIVPGFERFNIGPSEVSLTARDGMANIDLIRTPEELRGQGAARSAMEQIIDAADRQGLALSLTADPMDAATSKKRLEDFYRGLGFAPNSGKAKDYSTRAGMIRQPR